MTPPSQSTLGALARRADEHDQAAREELFVTLYGELHKIAESHIRRQAGNVTLGATTLLHEAYLDISRRDALAFPDRHRFFAYASRAMRGLVIDYVRNRGAERRGGAFTFTTLDDRHAAPDDHDARIERLRA
ncbi:MAG: ECF-type sigma factor, partial [Vicinamibacterales bacterium]